jgi:hypothetical protein
MKKKLIQFIRYNIHMVWLSVRNAQNIVDTNLIIQEGRDFPIAMQWSAKFGEPSDSILIEVNKFNNIDEFAIWLQEIDKD